MKQKTLLLITTCLALSLSSAFAMAKPQRPHKTPPPEAFELCESKNIGDEVTIITREGDEIAASCQNLPDDDSVLVAVPNEHKGRKVHSD
jgi:hypothetical protein